MPWRRRRSDGTMTPSLVARVRDEVRAVIGGLGVAVATLALMVATGPKLAIVWDEGYTLGREARVRAWFRALADPSQFSAALPPELGRLVQAETSLPRPPRPAIGSRAELFEPRMIA